MPPTETPEAAPRPKPRLALAIATVFGVGYAPKAPGTFGSVIGILVAVVSEFFPIPLLWLSGLGVDIPMIAGHPAPMLLFLPSWLVFLFFAILGVWAASRVARYSGLEDPQHVVIDEVSGQHLTFLLGLFPIFLGAGFSNGSDLAASAFMLMTQLLNWKCLLLGFILFRVFDIWKPFPVRQLEKLPGGWGIMADDWMAAVYAALVLRLVIHLRWI
ncbi:MAG: phosphatidylglycerophosphatase A [Acidobacteriia bacterium]|nr:phosphatidylglycerophosphatase A [Terriglobia bacterium]